VTTAVNPRTRAQNQAASLLVGALCVATGAYLAPGG
jgi:hypothetical protein